MLCGWAIVGSHFLFQNVCLLFRVTLGYTILSRPLSPAVFFSGFLWVVPGDLLKQFSVCELGKTPESVGKGWGVDGPARVSGA